MVNWSPRMGILWYQKCRSAFCSQANTDNIWRQTRDNWRIKMPLQREWRLGDIELQVLLDYSKAMKFGYSFNNPSFSFASPLVANEEAIFDLHFLQSPDVGFSWWENVNCRPIEIALDSTLAFFISIPFPHGRIKTLFFLRGRLLEVLSFLHLHWWLIFMDFFDPAWQSKLRVRRSCEWCVLPSWPTWACH